MKWAYRDYAMFSAQVFRWYKAFLEGHEIMENEPWSGRASTPKTHKNDDKVRTIMRSDQ